MFIFQTINGLEETFIASVLLHIIRLNEIGALQK